MAGVDSKCCMSITLREACLIIGYLSLIFLSYLFVTTIGSTTTGVSIESSSPYPNISKYFIIAEILLSMTFTILLVIGVHQNKRGFVKAFLIFKLISLVLYVIGLFAELPKANLRRIVNDLGAVCVSMYVLMIVKNYYFALIREDEPDIECEIAGSETD